MSSINSVSYLPVSFQSKEEAEEKNVLGERITQEIGAFWNTIPKDIKIEIFNLLPEAYYGNCCLVAKNFFELKLQAYLQERKLTAPNGCNRSAVLQNVKNFCAFFLNKSQFQAFFGNKRSKSIWETKSAIEKLIDQKGLDKQDLEYLLGESETSFNKLWNKCSKYIKNESIKFSTPTLRALLELNITHQWLWLARVSILKHMGADTEACLNLFLEKTMHFGNEASSAQIFLKALERQLPESILHTILKRSFSLPSWPLVFLKKEMYSSAIIRQIQTRINN